jgi:hypothetical protein
MTNHSVAVGTVRVSRKPCRCRPGPCWSCGMFVFMQDAAETVASGDGEVRDLVRDGDRFGQCLQRSEVRDASMGPVLVVVPLVLVQQVRLVPDQRAVEQLAAAGLDLMPTSA